MIAAVVALAVLPGQAQDTVTLPPMVTLARHPDSLAHLPFAATAYVVTAATAATGRSLAGVLAFAPGLDARDRGNPSRDDALALRGTGARASFGVRGLRVLLDGIPQTLPDGQAQLSGIDPAAIVRVEVLRGAASALYGNAAGGAVLLTTAAPGGTAARLDARIDGRGATRVGLAQAVAGAALGLRVTAAHERGAGWRRHSGFTTSRVGVALRASGARSRLAAHLTVTDQPRLEDPGALTAGELAADARAAHPGFQAADARKAVRHLQGGVAASSGGIEGALWGQHRDLRNVLPFVDIALDRVAGGARVAVHGRAAATVRLGAGVEAQAMRDDRVNRDPATGDAESDQLETVAEVGPWVSARWAPAPRWNVLVAGRLDAVRFGVTDRRPGGGPDARTLAAPSVSAGVALAAHPALRPWASVATLFLTPTTTELTLGTAGAALSRDLAPERGVQLEAGVRGQAGRARWEVVGFRAVVRDALVPYESPDEPGRFLYRNAGRVTRRGIEVSVDAAPGPLVTVAATLAVSDLRYDAFATPQGTFDGRRVPGVPVRRATVRGRLGDDARWLALAWQLSSRVPVDDGNTAYAAGWSLLDLRAGGRVILAGTPVAAWVGLANVLDASWVGSVQVNANAGRFYEPGAGRLLTVGISVSPPTGGQSSSAPRSRR